MAAKLQTIGGTDVDPKAFYDLVMHPTDALLGDYPWLLDESIRPKGASLEGFLYPATYSIQVGDDNPTTAEDLVRQMLDAFHDRVGRPARRPGQARPDLLPGADAGLDRRARGAGRLRSGR